MEDVKEGKSTVADREGNNRSDQTADRGAEMVGGKGLATLRAWVVIRCEQYKRSMKSIRTMIAIVTLANKNERAKDKTVKNGTGV